MDGAEDEQQRRVPGQLRPEVSVDFQTKFSSSWNFDVALSFAMDIALSFVSIAGLKWYISYHMNQRPDRS